MNNNNNNNNNNNFSLEKKQLEKLIETNLHLEKEFIIFKNNIDNNMTNLIKNIDLLSKNIEKLNDFDKSLIKITHALKTSQDKIQNLEKNMNYITKLFITTIIVAILNFFFSYSIPARNDINQESRDSKIIDKKIN